MIFPQRIVIFSVAGAPYRDLFYRLIAEHLPGSTTYVKVLTHAPDHAWSATISNGEERLSETLMPAVVLRGRGPLKRWRSGRNPLVIPTPATWRKISALDADIVLIQEYSPIAVLFAIWARLNGRVVVTMSEIGRKTAGLKFSTKVRHWLGGQLSDAQLAHTIAACTPIAPSITRTCFSPHAIDIPPDRHYAESQGSIVKFLFVGNLIERKGVDLLLAAVKQLVKNGYSSRFKLRLVGGGDLAWLQAQLKELGDQVELAGFKEKEALAAEYEDADVFVLPSRYDTFGVVAHEAASHGLALVLSEHAGCSELFGIREEAAKVIDPEDAVAFAGVLADLIDQPASRTELGKAAHKAAERWSTRENARRVADWLATLGADHPSSDTTP